MVTPQEVKQQAANLTTEQRAAVNTQLAGMSQEDLAKRSQAATAPVPQAWPEPELFSEPLAQQPQQAPVEPQALQQPQALVEPVQQPVEPPKVEPIKPIKTEDPVQKVQEVKNQAIINEADEIAVQEQKKTQITSEFQQKLQSGASIKELADFARKNEQFSDIFRDSIRTQFKTQENTKFYAKYNGLSNESMYSAVKSGAIKIWSERYNLLSEAQRQSFEQFKAAKDAPAGIPTTKEEVFNPNTPENSVDFNNIENFANKMFNSDLRKQLDELRNDNRVVSLTQELNAKASELEIFDIEGIRENDNLEDELWNAWFSPAYIRAKLRDNSANRAIERMSKVSEYNRVQWDLQSIRDDIESDIRLFEYEDQQARDKYAFLFNAYESRRGEQRASEALESEREFQRGIRAEDREFSRQQTEEEREYQREIRLDDQAFEFSMSEFEEANRQLATDRALQNSKELYKFQNEIEQGNVKWQWLNRSDWLYFAHDDGNIELKINGNTDYQSDGVSVYTYVWENGQPKVEYRDITGNVIWASTSNSQFTEAQVDLLNAPAGTMIPTRLKELSPHNPGGKECAEYVNDIFWDALWGRLWSLYNDKLKIATEKSWWVGSVAVWQPDPSGEYSKWGHAGVIVWESEDGKSWHIKSSNIKGDGIISVDEVPKSVIDGYKTTPLYNKPIEQAEYNTQQTKFLESTALEDYSSNDKIKETAESLWLTTDDIFAFKANNIDPAKKEELSSVLTGINDLLWAGWGDGLSDALWLFSAARFFKNESESSPNKYVAWTDAADFEAAFKSLESKLTLENLDKMTGILTDKDLEVLKWANTSLSLTMSEKAFTKELDKIKVAAQNALDVFSALDNNFYTDESWTRYSREALADELSWYIESGDMTAQEVKQFLKDNKLEL